jgi:hypothetical protein
MIHLFVIPNMDALAPLLALFFIPMIVLFAIVGIVVLCEKLGIIDNDKHI